MRPATSAAGGHLGGRPIPGQPDAVALGPVGEQPHCLGGPDRVRVVAVGRRAHRRHPVDPLAVDAERFPARREQRDVRAVPEQGVGELGARVDDVLAVVEQHQQGALADRVGQRGDQRLVGVRGDAEHVGDRDRYQVLVVQRGEIGEPDAVPRAVQQPGRDLEPEPGLARPARAGERDQAGGGDQPAYLGQLGVAADEARHLGRQVVQQFRVVKRRQRREDGRQAVGVDLEDLLGAAEVLQPVQAEVPDTGARRQRVREQGGRGGREHDLAPVRDRRDPGRAVHLEADEADRRPRGLAGVDAHADPDVLAGGPGVGPQCALHVDRRGHAGARRREHREERVALGVHLLTVVRVQAGPDDPVVIGQHPGVGVPELPQHRRGALDVGEQERQRLHSRRPGNHLCPPPSPVWPARPRAGPGSRGAAPSASMTGVMMRALFLRGRGEAR